MSQFTDGFKGGWQFSGWILGVALALGITISGVSLIGACTVWVYKHLLGG